VETNGGVNGGFETATGSGTRVDDRHVVADAGTARLVGKYLNATRHREEDYTAGWNEFDSAAPATYRSSTTRERERQARPLRERASDYGTDVYVKKTRIHHALGCDTSRLRVPPL